MVGFNRGVRVNRKVIVARCSFLGKNNFNRMGIVRGSQVYISVFFTLGVSVNYNEYT